MVLLPFRRSNLMLTETEQIPVILLIAIAQTAEKHQFHDLGFRGVITKPLNSLELKIFYW